MNSLKTKRLLRLYSYILLLLIIVVATIYIHYNYKTGLIISHCYYIPILLAAYWWKKKGVFVAIGSGIFIVLVQVIFLPTHNFVESILRAVSFILVGLLSYYTRERVDSITQQLKKTHVEVFKILNMSSTGMMILDESCNIVRMNDTLMQILKIPPEKLVGLPLKCHDLINEPFGNCNFCPINYLRKGRFFHDKDITLKDMEGNDVECIVRARSLALDDRGNVEHILVDVIDISDRKNNEKKLSEYQDRLRSLASELALAEERERRRLATNLHDSVCQTLFITKMKLGVLKKSCAANLGDNAGEFEEIYQNTNRALNETRTLMLELSPPILYELGLEAAIEWYLDHIKNKHAIEFSYQDDGNNRQIDDDIKILLFQSVRELLNNVIKHASASKASIKTFKGEHYIRMEVVDNGSGFRIPTDALPIKVEAGFGLFNLKERLKYYEGTLHIESEKSRGSKVVVIAPYNNMQKTGEKNEHQGFVGR